MLEQSQRFTLSRENVREALERLLVFVGGMAGIKSGVIGLEQVATIIEPLREAVANNPDTSTFIAATLAIFSREFCRGGLPPSNPPALPSTPPLGQSPASPGV